MPARLEALPLVLAPRFKRYPQELLPEALRARDVVGRELDEVDHLVGEFGETLERT